MIPVHGAHSALRLYPIHFPTTFKKAVFNSVQIIFFFSNGSKGYGQRCHSINISFQFNLFHQGREEEFQGQMGKPCSVIILRPSAFTVSYCLLKQNSQGVKRLVRRVEAAASETTYLKRDDYRNRKNESTAALLRRSQVMTSS